MNEKELNTFLAYGFVIRDLCDNKNFNMLKSFKKKEINKDLISHGVNLFRSLFKNYNPSDKILVPLSGGLDSRAILIGLLSSGFSSENISTFTLGKRGLLDYDIGKSISKQLNIRNQSIDLQNRSFSHKELLQYAKKFQHPSSFIDGYYNHLIFKHNEKKHKTLVGYMGDPIAGSHLFLDNDWLKNIIFFDKIHKKSTEIDLFNPIFEPINVLPDNPLVGESINYFDQLDFIYRQEYLVHPIVVSNSEIYESPFHNFEWLSFFLNAGTNNRKGRVLFKKILEKIDYKTFHYNSKETYGLPGHSSNYIVNFFKLKRKLMNFFSSIKLINYEDPMLNYLDFGDEIRRGNLKDIVKLSIDTLVSKNIMQWIDITKILEDHLNGKDYSRSLIRLVNLELYLSSR